MTLEIIVIIGLIIGIVGVIVFYCRKSKSLESVISKRFSDKRDQELLESSKEKQDELIEYTKKFQELKTTIEFLSDTKLSLEQKLEQLTVNSRIELAELREDMELKSHQANKKSLAFGQNIIKGELVQILASFSILTEYNAVALISSVSKHASFDIIGVTADRIDFIEVKTNNSPLSPNEINIKKIIESKNVFYKIIEGKIPISLEIKTRKSDDDENTKQIKLIPQQHQLSTNTHAPIN